jgi:hypothetical protein
MQHKKLSNLQRFSTPACDDENTKPQGEITDRQLPLPIAQLGIFTSAEMGSITPALTRNGCL